MRNDELSIQSMDFAVSIINLVKDLKVKHESVISNQIGRSGTSIGANIREAQYAHGKADFYSKTANIPERGKRNRLLAGAVVSNRLFVRGTIQGS